MEDARAAAKNDGRWLFQRAAEGKRAKRRFWRSAMHTLRRCLTDPIRLPGHMHVYVANGDPEIREVVRIGYGDLVAYAEQVSGLSPERISSFLATGMLLSVLALMQVQDGAEHWAETLLEGCMRSTDALVIRSDSRDGGPPELRQSGVGPHQDSTSPPSGAKSDWHTHLPYPRTHYPRLFR
jgi:hypothetical protein